MGVGKRFGPMADSALAAEDSSPGLFVTLRVCDETIRIPCGDGGQSLRWLSQVAAQRYTMLHAAKGRPRQRETHTEPQGAFLPRNVFATTSGAMLGPSMTVKEALGAVTGAGKPPRVCPLVCACCRADSGTAPRPPSLLQVPIPPHPLFLWS